MLSDSNIQRQDFVDDTIYNMIEEILRYRGKKLLWDIEVIAEIRDIIIEHYMNSEEEEFEFYPWVTTES